MVLDDDSFFPKMTKGSNFIPGTHQPTGVDHWLVGQGHPVLKNMSSSMGMIRNSQLIWENKIDGNQTTNQIMVDRSHHEESYRFPASPRGWTLFGTPSPSQQILDKKRPKIPVVFPSIFPIFKRMSMNYRVVYMAEFYGFRTKTR